MSNSTQKFHKTPFSNPISSPWNLLSPEVCYSSLHLQGFFLRSQVMSALCAVMFVCASFFRSWKQKITENRKRNMKKIFSVCGHSFQLIRFLRHANSSEGKCFCEGLKKFVAFGDLSLRTRRNSKRCYGLFVV